MPRAATARASRSAPHGVTAIETLVVVTILAILLAATAPSFRSFLAAQQLKSIAYDLTTDLLMARSEALKRNTRVALTASAQGWEGGWVVTSVTPAVEIRRRVATVGSVAVANGPASITFDLNGRVLSAAADVRFSLSTGRDSGGRCVELDLSGRARSMIGVCT